MDNDDIWGEILSRLDIDSLLNMSQTCYYFNDYICNRKFNNSNVIVKC